MTQSSLAKELASLAESSQNRSLAARLRDVFPEIEHALQKGVSRGTILEALQSDGMDISMKTFESALYRMRKAKLVSQNKKLNNDETTHTNGNISTKPAERHAAKSKEAPLRLKPMTPADFQKIRDNVNNMDLDALIKGKAIIHTEPKTP